MKVYCIGVGGIGLSALARYYKHKGYEVSGSDMADSALIQTLVQEGIHVDIGHRKENIQDGTDLVVYTIAVSDMNEDLVRARELGCARMTYPEALGEITKEKTTIAVCGTHGKTTTTAMTYHALKACGINPTVIVGSLLAGVGTNFIAGDSEFIVVEACEYRRSFLNLHPKHIIVTNIDADHLDYYKDISDIHDAFQEFADKVPSDGYMVAHGGSDLLTQGKKIDADSIDINGIMLSVIGKHNQANAQLVIALLRELGLPEEKIREGLKEFKGTWRRLEYKGKTAKGIDVYDDYGHHPTELRATIDALKEKYGNRLIYIFFQPHLFSRTKMFMESFADVLKNADRVYLMPIYAARELDDGTVTSSMLMERINELGGSASLLDTALALSPTIEAFDDPRIVAVNIGAGDAYAELNKIFYI
jgi:UDP-N-acetylmuramate--alanine ligase